MKIKNITIIFLVCCGLAIVASVIASEHPDGLEWVAEKLNFLDKGEGRELIKAPMAGYSVPWIKSVHLSGAAAGILGTAVTFVVVYLIGRLFRRSNIKDQKSK